MNHIHPTAIIYPNVTLGDNIYIGPYSVIGGPPEHKTKVDPREEPKFGVQIWDNTIITSHVTIDAGVEGDTFIGADCYIMSKAHIGHDSMIGMTCIIHSGAIIGGHSIIRPDSRIGLGAVLHQRTRIPIGTMVGAQAFVKGIHEIPYRIIAGVPAKDIGPNQRLIDQLNEK